MLLTPETLFYSTRSHAYEIPVSSIASIEASTGLLNRKITLFETNGAEHKLPYAVKTNEMEDWAGILEGFIQYLQQKPASRKLNYLAKKPTIRSAVIAADMCIMAGTSARNAGIRKTVRQMSGLQKCNADGSM